MLTIRIWMMVYCILRGADGTFDRMAMYRADYILLSTTPSSSPVPAGNAGSKPAAPISLRSPSKIASNSLPFQQISKSKRPASLSKVMNGQAVPSNKLDNTATPTPKLPVLTDPASTVSVSVPLVNAGFEDLMRATNASNSQRQTEPLEATRIARLETGSEENARQKTSTLNTTSDQQPGPVEVEQTRQSRPLLLRQRTSDLLQRSFVSSPDVLPYVSRTHWNVSGVSGNPAAEGQSASDSLQNTKLQSEPDTSGKLRSRASASLLTEQFLAGNGQSQTNESSTFARVSSASTAGSNSIHDQSSLSLLYRADNVSTSTQLLDTTTTMKSITALTTAPLRDETDMPVRNWDFDVATTTQRSTKTTTTPILASWLHLYCGITTWASYPYCIDYLHIGITGQKGAIKFTGASCPAGQFKCDNERCVYRRKVCNGRNDCKDNSDEGLRACPKRTKDTVNWTGSYKNGSSESPSYFLATADQLAQLFTAGNKQKGRQLP